MFNIEFCTSCCFDSVKVYDGADDSAPLIGLFCGGKLPEDLISSSNYLFVSFKSDAYVRKDGFRSTYNTKGKLLVGDVVHVLVILSSTIADSRLCHLLFSASITDYPVPWANQQAASGWATPKTIVTSSSM